MIRSLLLITVIAGLCSFTIADDSASTKIVEPSDQPIYISLGGSLHMKCIQKNGRGMLWLHNGTRLENGKNKVTISSSIVNMQWESIFMRLNMSILDAGTYSCLPDGYHANLGYNVPVYVKGQHDEPGSTKTEIIEPAKQPVYIVAGNTLKLTCRQTEGSGMQWSQNGNIIDTNKPNLDISGFDIYQFVKGGRQFSTLQKDQITANDSAQYGCEPNDRPKSEAFFTNVFVHTIVAKGDTLYGYNRTAVLQCTLVGEVEDTRQVEWYHQGEKLDLTLTAGSNDIPKYIVEYENNTVTIKYVGKEDLGEYSCVFPMNTGNFTATMLLQAEPRVKNFPKSKNLVQGEPLQLECDAYGYPTPVVTWYKDNVMLNDTDERVSFKPFEGLENATIRIEDLDFDDRGDYTCRATNIHGDGESVILVRVKDKLAALWPFLGICVEVAILCVIIFIYEKKRAKKMEEEERQEEADHLTNSNDHKGKDDVRQRK